MAYANADYIVLEAGTPVDLERKVNKYLQDNYRLQGGVMIVTLGDDNYLYAQAMTFNVDVE